MKGSGSTVFTKDTTAYGKAFATEGSILLLSATARDVEGHIAWSLEQAMRTGQGGWAEEVLFSEE